MKVTKHYENDHVMLYVEEGDLRTCITLDSDRQIKRLAECLNDLARTDGREVSINERSAEPCSSTPEMKALLSQKIEELNLTVRTLNLLKANDINTIRDLCRLKKTDWLNFRNSGMKSLTELDDFLAAHNLTWGMNV